jgi:hypothetical protein
MYPLRTPFTAQKHYLETDLAGDNEYVLDTVLSYILRRPWSATPLAGNWERLKLQYVPFNSFELGLRPRNQYTWY